MKIIGFTPKIVIAEDGVTAHCEELGLVASGESEHVARERLRLTVASFFRALARRGMDESALSDSGLDVVMEVSWPGNPDAELVALQ